MRRGRSELVLLAVLGMAAPADADELRLATLAPEGSAWMKILEATAEDVERATEGRVTFKFYAGGSQGDERDVVRKLKLGQLDGGVLTSVGLSLVYPGIRVLELPFLFESVAEVDAVRGAMWPGFEDEFTARGFWLAAAGDVGWSYLYSNRPIETRADLGKIKVWAWQDDAIVRALYRRLSLSGVPLGVPEVLTALQTDRIDAVYGPPLAAVALQWHTEVTHVTSLPVAYSMGAVVFREEALDGLSADDRAALATACAAMGKQLVKRVRRDNQRALKAMVKGGLTIVSTPPALATWFESESKGVWTDLAGKVYSEEELETALALRDALRAERKKPSKQ